MLTQHLNTMHRKPIPYGKQHITDDDLRAVEEVLMSDYLTQGPKIQEFESAFARYVGAEYAVAVSNGTAALHLAVMALGIQDGEKVIGTSITFAASSNCIRYCGGEVVFADIDPETYLIDIGHVESLLKAAPAGTFKGMVVVDFAGRAVNLEALKRLAEQYGLWIIEDACHAPGGYFIDSSGNRQLCGNGVFADLSIFSFHPVKHIACGEGGMITTNNKVLYDQLCALRTHGITKNAELFHNPVELAAGQLTEQYPLWYMEMQELGYNYRLTDFQAALGLSQLNQANHGLERRIEIAKKYAAAFRGKKFLLGQSGFIEGHAYHLYVLEVNDRLGLYNYLRSQSVFAQIHYFPTHLMPYYQLFGWKPGDLPLAENYYKHCISIPMYPTLTGEEQDFVIESILRYYNEI